MSMLAICAMKKFAPDNYLVLYTDCRECFEGIPFDEIIDVDFFDWDWDTRYWNVPKMKTYSMQSEPFVHMDLDIIPLQNFSFPDTQFITELVRPLTKDDINIGCMKNIYKNLPEPIMNVCSGIIGISDLSCKIIFDEMYDRAKELCIKTDDAIEFGNLFSIEEASTYQMVKSLGIEVGSMNPLHFMHFSGNRKEENFSAGVDMLIKNFGIPCLI